MQDAVRIVIAYHSRRGHTERMAQEVRSGAASVAGTATLLTSVEQVGAEELLAADGLIVGSPVYTGSMAAPVKAFFEDWHFRFDFYPSWKMRGKVGGAFATGGHGAGGRELTILSILAAMLHHRMLVLSGESPVGASAATEAKAVAVDENELAEAFALGQRVAEVAALVRRGRQAA
jgi:NAD(P)H dehydrogenase (quinone)